MLTGLGKKIVSTPWVPSLSAQLRRASTASQIPLKDLLENQRVIILTTKWWHPEVFTDVMTLHPDLEALQSDGRLEFFNVDDTSAAALDESSQQFQAKILEMGRWPAVVTLTDNSMYVFAQAAEALVDHVGEAKGTSWDAFVACTHKLIARERIPVTEQVPFKGVTADDPLIPDLGVGQNLIVKPTLGVSSLGVYSVKPGDPNPFYGLEVQPCDMIDITDKNAPELVTKEMTRYIGIVEEYVDWDWKRVSCDGFVHNGKMYPWCIADNEYSETDKESFDRLLVPTNALTEEEQNACWSALEMITDGLHSEFGFDNQFICTEFFVLGNRTRVLEVNPRISANQAPCFPVALENGDCVEAMVRLQLGDCPPVPKPKENLFGVSLYRDPVPNAPHVVHKPNPGFADSVYYDRLDKDAHVYAYDSSPEAVVERANSYFQELHQKFA